MEMGVAWSERAQALRVCSTSAMVGQMQGKSTVCQGLNAKRQVPLF